MQTTNTIRKAIANGFTRKNYSCDLIADAACYLENLARTGKLSYEEIEGEIKGGRTQFLYVFDQKTGFTFEQDGDITEMIDQPYTTFQCDFETGIVYKITANWTK